MDGTQPTEARSTRTLGEFASEVAHNPLVETGAAVLAVAAVIASRGKLASVAERFLPKASTLLGEVAESKAPAAVKTALPDYNLIPTPAAAESMAASGRIVEKVQQRLMRHQRFLDSPGPDSELKLHQYVGRASAHLTLGHADLALRDVDLHLTKIEAKGLRPAWTTLRLRSEINAELGNSAAAEADLATSRTMYDNYINTPDFPDFPELEDWPRVPNH